MEYTLTEHVKQRYAERLKDKTDKSDISVFIAQNQDRIFKDIEKMVDYGKVLYTGASVVDYNKAVVQVILNGHWVLICDPKQKRVVTLFEIDLGLGKDFNDEYVIKLLEKLATAQASYDETVKTVDEQDVMYQNLISENETKIKEYRSFIKALEEQNENYVSIRKSINNNKIIAEQQIRDVIAVFCGKKVF